LPRDKRGKHSRFGSHPDANDHQRLFECLKNFRRTKKLIQPIFDRATGKVVQEIACDNINIVIADAVLYFNSRRRFTIRKIVE
jgi:uridine kinase